MANQVQPGQVAENLVNGGNPGNLHFDSGGALIGGVRTQGGTVTLNGATPVAVADPGVTANSIILFTLKTATGTVSPNSPNVLTVTPGTGFTVGGTALDLSVYNWVRLG